MTKTLFAKPNFAKYFDHEIDASDYWAEDVPSYEGAGIQAFFDDVSIDPSKGAALTGIAISEGRGDNIFTTWHNRADAIALAGQEFVNRLDNMFPAKADYWSDDEHRLTISDVL